MITLTARNDVRCSIRPDQIVAIEPGPCTTIVLHTGVALAVRESPEEVRRLLEVHARTATLAVTPGAKEQADAR